MDIEIDLIIAGIINFGVLFFGFKYLLGDKIVKHVEERKELLNKLKGADEEYKKLIEFAKKESESIISKAEKTKNDIIHEAHLIAEDEKKKIIKEGENKVENMKNDAKLENAKIEKQLKEERVDSVKSTSKMVIKKIFNEDKNLSEEYLSNLIKDLKNAKN